MIKKVKGNKRKMHRRTLIDTSLLYRLPHVMKLARYTYRPFPINDWIKIDKEGRFHLKKSRDLHSLHYDIYGENCDHYSIPMPFKCTKEKRRIISIAKSLDKHLSRVSKID